MKILPFSLTVLLLLVAAFFITSPTSSYASSCDYQVKNDDLLSLLSLEWYGNFKYWKEIAQKNKLKPPYSLYPGQCLTLPRPRTLSTKDGEKKVYEFWLARMNQSDSSSTTSIPARSAPSVTPVEVEEEPLPEINPYGLKASIGPALTYLSYTETDGPKSFKINEMGLTIKGALSLLLSSRFELNANAFGTLIPYSLSKSPADMGNSRFYGVNGRFGFKFLELSPRDSVWIMLGGYMWGQLVSNQSVANNYGVSILTGPQAQLLGRFHAPNNHAWFIYLKYAAMNSLAISAQNCEIATGVAYQISSPRNPKKWFLTIDASKAQYSDFVENIAQGFTFYSTSLGITTEL